MTTRPIRLDAVAHLAPQVGITAAAEAVGLPRSAVYRARQEPRPPSESRRRPANALTPEERQAVVALLTSERFVDLAPRAVYATLLDDGDYRCSWSTMYRILRAEQLVGERRAQRQHPPYQRPELLATQPRQLWSWDITLLRGPGRSVYYYLYMIIDVYSRYIVGWMVMECERAELAEQLIAQTCQQQGISRDQLTLHADRGSSMTSRSVAQLLADLGVQKTHSRPHVSNDNPYSEAQFKTLKYRPDYPDRFGCIEDARSWVRAFVRWYNHEHRHTGLALLTPATVHCGQVAAVQAARQAVLTAAYTAHPARFSRPPQPGQVPEAVWINPPRQPSLDVPPELEQTTDQIRP